MPFELDKDAIRRIIRETDDRLIESGRRAVEVAQRLVHVDTGLLRSRIFFSFDPRKHVLYLRADTPYAAIEEEGSIYREAHPYLRPAMNAIGDYWMGGTAIYYPSAVPRSNKRANPAIAAANRRITQEQHRGASRFAHVRYRRGRSHIGSRWSPTRPDYWFDHRNDVPIDVTPIG